MSSTRKVRAKDLSEGDVIRFEARGKTKIGKVLQVREHKGDLRIDVTTTGGGYMTRQHAPDEELDVQDEFPEAEDEE